MKTLGSLSVAVLLGLLGLCPMLARAQEITDRVTLLEQYQRAETHTKAGRSQEAARLYEKLVKAAPDILGAESLDTASLMTNLAELYRDMGQYALALPLFKRSLAIREARLGDHTHVATSLHNLADLYQRLGQYARAEPLYRRSLAIYQANLPGNDPYIASSCNNLALLYESMGQYEKAEPFYQRALKIFESQPGKELEAGRCLNNLAKLSERLGQDARAESLYLRSLRIYAGKLSNDDPEAAFPLNNLALLYLKMGKPDLAERVCQRAVQIREAKLPKDHPDLVHSLNNLARVREAAGRTDEAADLIDRARRSSRRHVTLVLGSLSAREQTNFLQHNDQQAWHGALSLGLRHAASDALVSRSATWLLNGKAVAHQTAAQAALLARDSSDPQLGDLARQLGDLRQQLARLSLATPQPGQQQQQRQLERLQTQEADLARRLHQAGDPNLRPHLWVEVDRLRQSLPADAAFIDLARFAVYDFKAKDNPWQAAHYAAWITKPPHPTLAPSGGEGRVRGGPVVLVDLGPAEVIDKAVQQVRQALTTAEAQRRKVGEPEAEAALRQPLKALAKQVLQPLLPHIGKTRRWLISPDAQLWLVPWAALLLPDGKYAVEEHPISYVVSGRDLVPANVPANVKPSAPLVLADPDFDLGLDKVARETRRLLGESAGTGSLGQQLGLGRVRRLEGTATEARAIAPRLKAYTGAEPRLYLEEEALAGVFRAARNPRVVVLSTHGYFLPNTPDKGIEDPLLRCGLLLAGCNNAAAAGDGDNGVLTGLQIVGTDLRGCELVVLSACETGLGDVHNGEGVAGLRQAFQLAGADSVVATLWKIPDHQSAQLMIKFFDQLASKRSKADALRNAQLAIIKARREKFGAAHPFSWAAFTLTGE